MLYNKKRTILFFVSLIGIVVTSLLLVSTYAYQTVQTKYEDETKSNLGGDTGIEVGNLEVNYTASNKIELTNMTFLPDYKTADYVEFTIDNTKSTYGVGYQLELINLTYSSTLVTNIFKYTITQVTSNGDFVIGHGDFSGLTGKSINLPFTLNKYRFIEKGTSETLRLYLWLEETNNAISGLKNSNFKGQIKVTSLFSNEINEKFYTKLKVGGNSIQDTGTLGEPSPTNLVPIESLGTLVTDESSENYGKYEIPIKVSGKNLFSKQDYEGVVNWGSSNFGIVKVNVEKNKYYTFSLKSFERIDPIEGGNIVMYIYNNEALAETGRVATFLLNNTGTSEPAYNPFKVNINSGDNTELYFKIRNTSGTSTNIKVNGMMLEKGASVTAFEPYIEPINTSVYLDEPLRKVGEVSDYLDFVNQRVVRNIKKNIFVGSESWTIYKQIDDSWTVYATRLLGRKERYIMSNYLPFVDWAYATTVKKATISTDSGIKNIYIKTDIPVLNDFKTWLSNNNLEFQYVLSEPLEKKINLPFIPVTSSNYISVCSNNGVCGTIESETNY